MIHSVMEKEWRPHPKYPGYLFSPDGQCLSVKRYRKPDMILKTRINRDGYVTTTLVNGIGKAKGVFVHRIVADIYIVKPFESDDFRKLQVNHKNGVKTDNRLENLEWVTPRENQLHSMNVLKRRFAFGESAGSTKLSEKEVLEIKERLKTYKHGDYTILSKQYGVSIGNIVAIKVNRSWNHLTPTVHFDKPPLAPKKRYYIIKEVKNMASGSRNGNSKLTENKVIQIKKLLKLGTRKVDIAKTFSISTGTIKMISSNKIWRHIVV